MEEDGFVAPITVAADGEVLDGDARLETALDKFDEPPLVIRHDGSKPIVELLSLVVTDGLRALANGVGWKNPRLRQMTHYAARLKS